MSFHICFNVLGFYKPFRILHTLRTTATKDTLISHQTRGTATDVRMGFIKDIIMFSGVSRVAMNTVEILVVFGLESSSLRGVQSKDLNKNKYLLCDRMC